MCCIDFQHTLLFAALRVLSNVGQSTISIHYWWHITSKHGSDIKRTGSHGPVCDWQGGETEDNPKAPGGRSALQGRDAETVLVAKSHRSAPLMKIGYNIIIKAVREWSSCTHMLSRALSDSVAWLESSSRGERVQHHLPSPCLPFQILVINKTHPRPWKDPKRPVICEENMPRGKITFLLASPVWFIEPVFLQFLFDLLKMAV